ncbi:MAG: N-acetyl-gamma-glutamyl-phosphate reductase [Gammaproteobacteria bacterium]
MIKTGIVGATGYTGAELLRLLVQHPLAQITVVTSQSEKGKPVTHLFPHLRGQTDLFFTEPQSPALADCDVVFFATPNGTAMHQAGGLLNEGVRVIDLSADFRLRDANLWAQWYGIPHVAEDLLGQAVYGLPELNRKKISSARLVANPGCYPTAVILALLPLLEKRCIDTQNLIANAISGTSGAGRMAEVATLYAEVSESFRAYSVPSHRHLPEITQALQLLSTDEVSMTFVPHLAPMVRGIHATVYAKLTRDMDLQELYEQRYENEPFVDVMPIGSHPETRFVRGTNICRLAVHKKDNGDQLVLLSVIDNLVKGAAGQALQNMNLMCGIEETTGLAVPALSP